MAKKLAVIGGIAAGMSAAAKARRIDRDLEIVVFTDETRVSYGACGLPYYISGEIKKASHLVARTIEQFKEQGIKVRTQCRVEEIRPATRSLLIRSFKTGDHYEYEYDSLVIATGASARIPPIANADLNGVFKLRNVEDGEDIRQYLAEAKPQNAVIVGGGYIGLEMAEVLHQQGIKVAIVEMAPHLAPNMDRDMAEILQQYLQEQGIEVFTGEKVLALEGDAPTASANRTRVRQLVTDCRTLPADLVLLSAGVTPNSWLAGKAGLALGAQQAIRVNERMETSEPGIYAAGDCATTFHLVTGEEVYIPMGTTANKQGRTAGENAAGGNAEFKGVVGTGIARVLDLEIARTGLTERECQQRGLNYEAKMIQAKTLPGFFARSGKIYVKALAEPGAGRLLGAQIVGFAGAGKRIDVFATALTLGATMDQLEDLDLAYAPPFSPVYDPILIAINQF
jgi:NADPH-dependent 2,4-dienoyl-CoA reductase/sulfur reductase-like enzyme